MKESKRILFISQQIYPFLDTETPIRMRNRQMPEYFQSHGFETRTFMPKFGEINERRNQLHEVIRLSGINLIVSDSDHPLLIKVASIQSARIQIYFIDNDDYFHRRKGVLDADGNEYKDNDERCIFFARGVLETVKKLRWTPDIICCSGWMSALVPLYVRRAYADTPFFENSKLVTLLDDDEYQVPFSSKFSEKLLVGDMMQTDVRSVAGLPVAYEDLMHLAIDYSDALVQVSPTINSRLLNYAQNRGKNVMPYSVEEDKAEFMAFCNSLLLEE
ncbi:MAG: glycogen/starch synthase [Paludibacteraceae bacterium]|nr:glycogen/starch synthase [Paludibacteraceae bacterium]